MLVQSVFKNGGNVASTTTTAIATTTGNLLVAFLSCENNRFGATPVTDSASNTWTQAVAPEGTSTGWSCVFYCNNATGSGTHTFTFTPTSTDYIVISVVEVYGQALASVLGSSAVSHASGSPHSAGPLTATAVQQMFFGMGTLSGSAGPTITSSYWATLTSTNSDGSHEGQILGVRPVDAGVSDTFTYTTSGGSGSEGVIIVGFKLATAGGSGGGGSWGHA